MSFREEVRNYLDDYNNLLEPVLEELISFSYPNDFHGLDFEISMGGFTQGFPVSVYFMEDACNELIFNDPKDKNLLPSTKLNLIEIPHVYPYELVEKYINKNPELNPWGESATELIEWFSILWGNVGGHNFKHNAYIAPHDSVSGLNLVSSAWEDRL